MKLRHLAVLAGGGHVAVARSPLEKTSGIEQAVEPRGSVAENRELLLKVNVDAAEKNRDAVRPVERGLVEHEREIHRRDGDIVTGAVEFAGLAAPPNFNRAIALHARARLFMKDIPAYETGVEWMGFRPSMPDSLPVIGPSTASPNVVYAFGHGHYGLTQAAATAELVADMIEERSSLIDLSPYSAQRF